jgi:hypothetical protein
MPNLNINIPDSTEAVKGIAELATQSEVNTGTDDTRIITPLKLEQSDLVQTVVSANTAKVGYTDAAVSANADVVANTAKETNATHTGEVTGSGALTVDKTAISNKTLVTAVAGDHVLVGDASDTDNLKKVNVSDFLGGGTDRVAYDFFNVNNGALSDSSTYYLGQSTNMGNTINAFAKIAIKGGTIREVHINTYNASTFGSADGSTLTFYSDDGVESNVITTNLLYTDRNLYQSFTGLSLSVSDGLSYFLIETPVFTTNPSATQTRIKVFIEL